MKLTKQQKQRQEQIADICFEQMTTPMDFDGDFEKSMSQLQELHPIKRYLILGSITYALLDESIDEAAKLKDKERLKSLIGKKQKFQEITQELMEGYLLDGRTDDLIELSESLEKQMRELFSLTEQE